MACNPLQAGSVFSGASPVQPFFIMVALDQAGRARNDLHLLRPPPGLAGFVEFMWVQRRLQSDATAAAWRIVADDAPHLLWHVSEVKGQQRHRLALVGARTRHVDADASARLLTVGVRLRPGAIPALFGPAAEVFTDRSHTLEEVAGTPGRILAEELSARAWSDAPQALWSFLTARVACRPAMDPRIRWLAAADVEKYPTVDALATALGLSSRAVRSLSRHHLGMGLARIRRIRRLHRALHIGLTTKDGTWTRAAAGEGYADQAHFIRDCRALLGETPRTFAARRD